MVSFKIESWIWFSIVMLIAVSRLISRRMALGSFRRFQADEYVMCVILGFYTTLIVTINIVAHTSSNLLPPGYDIAHMTKEDIDERTYGSKLILVVEESQCVVIWGAKACLLIMYLRLTKMRRENIMVKVLAGYVAVSFVVMEILYLGVWCRPFHNYWAVPTPNVQCDAATNHLITNAVFNLTSDLAMLAVGLPMFLRLTIPLSKKIPLVGIFSLGVFVVIAAILNKVYSFSQPFGSDWIYWYVRESSTALIVANLPFVWLLYRKIFGIHSVNGTRADRYGSDPYSFSFGPPSQRRRSSRMPSDLPAGRKTSGESDADLGMDLARARSGSMTMQEMLRTETLRSSNEKDVNPFTHPALFYGTGARSAGGTAPGMQKAVLRESDELEAVRRDSDTEAQYSNTPASSQTTEACAKSTGSFV